MTTALSLLLGYFGQDATGLLPTRLSAIAVGAALSVAAAWWLLPVRRPRQASARPPVSGTAGTFASRAPHLRRGRRGLTRS
jgi:uncharacterized membrane protein YccC